MHPFENAASNFQSLVSSAGWMQPWHRRLKIGTFSKDFIRDLFIRLLFTRLEFIGLSPLRCVDCFQVFRKPTLDPRTPIYQGEPIAAFQFSFTWISGCRSGSQCEQIGFKVSPVSSGLGGVPSVP